MTVQFADWAEAFAFTCLIEVPVLLAFLVAPLRWRALPLAFGVQIATHPAVWFLWTLVYFEPYESWLLVVEGWVFLTEAVLLAWALRRWPQQPWSWPRALGYGALAALVANVSSTLFGLWRHGDL